MTTVLRALALFFSVFGWWRLISLMRDPMFRPFLYRAWPFLISLVLLTISYIA